MKQMTAVEFLIEQLAKNGILHSSDIAKAKAMEKKQIIDANTHGFEDGVNYGKDLPMNFSSAEQYYNKTFKSE